MKVLEAMKNLCEKCSFCNEIHSWPENFKKSKPKKNVKSNKSISRNFVSNIQKKIREINSFHFTSFLAWTFLNFLAQCDYSPGSVRLTLQKMNLF